MNSRSEHHFSACLNFELKETDRNEKTMNRNMSLKLATALLSLSTFTTFYVAQPSTAHAQATAFTYQGRLTDGGAPANGSYDLRFKLFADPLGNTQAGSTIVSNGVSIASGLFTVTLDFGPGIFDGTSYWLEVGVKTNGAGAYANLIPLQPLTPTPYAVFAENVIGGALAAGTYTNAVTLNNEANNFSGSFVGDGFGLTNLNAATLDGFSAGQFWAVGGNSGTSPTNGNFLGTTDNHPLELKVNGTRVVRLERQTNAPVFGFVIPNVIAGFESNTVANGVGGATIAGGGGPEWYGPTAPNSVNGSFSTIGGGVGNLVNGVVNTIAGGERGTIGTNAYNAFLGGGAWNAIDAGDAAIGGGRNNAIQSLAYSSFIGGGNYNVIGTNAWNATIGGGYNNTIQANAAYSFLGGGYGNAVSASYATIPGGDDNLAAGQYSFAAGQVAQANHTGAFVWSDASSFTPFASTAANQFNVRATGGVRFVTSGAGLTVDGQSVALLNANQTFSGFNTFGDLSLESGGTYHHLQLSGGNALGYLYGSYPAFADGIHLGYNYYADAIGSGHVSNGGGATSRLTVGYGFVGIYVGGVNATPNTQRLLANSSGVTVNGTFNNSSDRNAKQDFAQVNPAQLLDKVMRLPISEWSYKDDPTTRHIGPMGQDFYATFNIGTDEKHIAPIDEGGVALAAIQGLKQKLDEELKRRDAENVELKRTVTELKAMIQAITQELNRAVR